MSYARDYIGQRGIRTPEGLSPPDLQSGAIDRSAICPSDHIPIFQWELPIIGLAGAASRSSRRESNPQPPVYKTGALPVELHERTMRPNFAL